MANEFMDSGKDVWKHPSFKDQRQLFYWQVRRVYGLFGIFGMGWTFSFKLMCKNHVTDLHLMSNPPSFVRQLLARCSLELFFLYLSLLVP